MKGPALEEMDEPQIWILRHLFMSILYLLKKLATLDFKT